MHDALLPYERDILAGWDAGQSADGIAAARGCSVGAVRQVVELYDDRPDPSPVPRLRVVNAEFVAAIGRERERSMRAAAVDLAMIVERATDRAEDVFRELFPNAVRRGQEMTIGNLHGDARTKSLSMNIGSGPRRGVWSDFASNVGGDVLDLVAMAMFAGDKGKAVAWLKSYLRLDGLDPARIAQHKLETEARRADREAEAQAEYEKRRRGAVSRWIQAKALAEGDPVVRYLAARGCDLTLLGRAPGNLRYHPELQYGANRSDGAPPLKLPAMVAQIQQLDGVQIGTHRTYLDPKQPAKAGRDLIGDDNPKKVLGHQKGGHIPLWKGAHPGPLHAIPAGTDVVAGEGIEDTLTAVCARPNIRAISFINVGNLSDMALPEQIGRLVLLRQNDPPGSDAAATFDAGVAAQRARGRDVWIVPVPRGVKDINELAQRGMAG